MIAFKLVYIFKTFGFELEMVTLNLKYLLSILRRCDTHKVDELSQLLYVGHSAVLRLLRVEACIANYPYVSFIVAHQESIRFPQMQKS